MTSSPLPCPNTMDARHLCVVALTLTVGHRKGKGNYTVTNILKLSIWHQCFLKMPGTSHWLLLVCSLSSREFFLHDLHLVLISFTPTFHTLPLGLLMETPTSSLILPEQNNFVPLVPLPAYPGQAHSLNKWCSLFAPLISVTLFLSTNV